MVRIAEPLSPVVCPGGWYPLHRSAKRLSVPLRPVWRLSRVLSRGIRFGGAGRRPVVVVRQGAGTEDRLADAYDGGALLDGDFVVTGHAHGQLARSDQVGIEVTGAVPQRAQQGEAGPHPVDVGA